MSKPKYIIFEDEPKHLEILAGALARSGRASAPLHVDENFDPAKIISEDHARRVRVMFSDLHLIGSQASSDQVAHFAVIASIIDAIQPGGGGPWLLVIWTEHDEEVASLEEYLKVTLEKERLPVAVVPLRKAEHLASPESLATAIDVLVANYPEIQALIDWEESVTDAAAETISTLSGIARRINAASKRTDGLRRILGVFAEASSGTRAADNCFSAVTSVLAPLVADRVVNAHKDGQHQDLWKQVVSLPAANDDLSYADRARLNSMLHIEIGGHETLHPCHIGTASKFPDEMADEKELERLFGPKADLLKHYKVNAAKAEEFSWYLVPFRAPCDFTNPRPGPIPFAIGIEGVNEIWCEGESDELKKGLKLSDALWMSPQYFRSEAVRRLLVSAYFVITIPEARAAGLAPEFRVREQLLAQLTTQLHAHGARAGVVSF